MTDDNELAARVQTWLAGEIDPDSRRELEALAADPAQRGELADRFASRLEFGTAGLRGLMGAGPNRMNRAVVVQTAYALGRYLGRHARSSARPVVAVAFDGRLGSRVFAEDTASVLAALGVTVHLFAEVQPTPMLAFLAKELDADAGVMVTASHNPPEYNGYKVYGRHGAQIIPPVDSEVAGEIATSPSARDVPRLSLNEARDKGLVVDVSPSHLATYVERVIAMAPVRQNVSLSIVYTAMHGVGDPLAQRVLAGAGFTNVFSVPEQQKPDGRFPTVRFPNPEEKGALDLAKRYATERNAELIIANDPDADRLAICVRAREGGYTQLTGNEVGVLLGHHVLTRLSRAERPALIASIVSSPMLGFIAREHGAKYEEVLTGFKWIASRAMELEREGHSFVFGYEEALGYTAFDLVRDKDGISAARLFADLVAHLHTEGRTIACELDALASRYGVWLSGQHTVSYDPKVAASAMAESMAQLRAAPPSAIAGLSVVGICDYQARTQTRGGATTALSLPRSNVLVFELEGGSRVMVRPSGTEPKTKVYLDARVEVAPGETVSAARARADARLLALKTAAPMLTKTA